MSLRNSKTATPEAIQNLAETNLEQAIRIRALEGMIRGLMDAMKPLLDEWKSMTAAKGSKDESR